MFIGRTITADQIGVKPCHSNGKEERCEGYNGHNKTTNHGEPVLRRINAIFIFSIFNDNTLMNINFWVQRIN